MVKFFVSEIMKICKEKKVYENIEKIAFYHNGSCCFRYAGIFAALAREIGYTPYMICGRVPGSRDGAADGFTRHCWVEINGLYYDPEAQYAGWMTGVYGYDYYPISHQIQRVVNFCTY